MGWVPDSRGQQRLRRVARAAPRWSIPSPLGLLALSTLTCFDAWEADKRDPVRAIHTGGIAWTPIMRSRESRVTELTPAGWKTAHSADA